MRGFDHLAANSTPLFRDLPEMFQLCLPLTGASHKVTATTWASPDDGEYTIDYVPFRVDGIPGVVCPL